MGCWPRDCGADGERGGPGPASPDSTVLPHPVPCTLSAWGPSAWSWDVGFGTGWLRVVALKLALQAVFLCLAPRCSHGEGNAHVTALIKSCPFRPRDVSVSWTWTLPVAVLVMRACGRGTWSCKGEQRAASDTGRGDAAGGGRRERSDSGWPRSRSRGACALLPPCSSLPPWLSPLRLRSHVGPASAATAERPADVARPPAGPAPQH